MDYLDQSTYNAISELSARIYEITTKLNTNLSMKDKLTLINERKQLIEERSKLM